MTGSGTLARNAYRDGQVLRARDLERDRDYLIAALRQHAAFAHGSGIVEGLRLIGFARGTETAVPQHTIGGAGAPPAPLDLFVEHGMALDALGRTVRVARREEVSTTLATEPLQRNAGWYRLLLLYQESGSAQSSGNGNGSAAGCGGMSAGSGGASVVHEGYRLRLSPEDEILTEPDRAAVLDNAAAGAAVEAPVILGYVYWNGADAYTSYAALERMHVPVRAQSVLTPDDAARLDLRDANGRVSLKTAPRSAHPSEPFLPAPLEERVRVDPDGTTWVQADVRVGPQGVAFRQGAAFAATNWKAAMQENVAGVAFDPAADGTAPYTAGDRELRVVFERQTLNSGSGEGRRRVVIGHVDDMGAADSFRPALIVYDSPPRSGAAGSSTVEVWGDLHVQGTSYLRQIVDKSDINSQDRLKQIMNQLAGPMGDMLTSYLLTDADWITDIAALVMGPSHVQELANSVAGALPMAANWTALTTAIRNAIQPTIVAAVKQELDTAEYRRSVVNGFTVSATPAELNALAVRLAERLNDTAARAQIRQAAAQFLAAVFVDADTATRSGASAVGVDEADLKAGLEALITWAMA